MRKARGVYKGTGELRSLKPRGIHPRWWKVLKAACDARRVIEVDGVKYTCEYEIRLCGLKDGMVYVRGVAEGKYAILNANTVLTAIRQG